MSAAVAHRSGASGWRGAPRLNVTASLQFVLSVRYHCVSGIDSVGHDRRVSLRQGNGDRLVLDRLVRVHGIDKRSLRTAQDGCRRDHGTVLPHLQEQVGIYE